MSSSSTPQQDARKYNRYRQRMQEEQVRHINSTDSQDSSSLGLGSYRQQQQQQQQGQQRQPPAARTRLTHDDDDTSNSSTNNNNNSGPPPIYAAPTTDTLGDESALFAARPYAVGVQTTPTRYRRPVQRFTPEHVPSSSSRRLATQPQRQTATGAASSTANNSSSIMSGQSTTAARSMRSTPSRRSTDTPRSPSRNSQPKSASSLRGRQHAAAAAVTRRRRTDAVVDPAQRDFCHADTQLAVQIKTVNTGQRSAFEVNPALPIAEWHAIAEQGALVRKTNMLKRLSPSLQHLELLHVMQSMTVTRQLNFSPSVGQHCDLFVAWNQVDSGGTIGGSSSTSKKQKDGRYRPIDPVKATQQALPESVPVLSNKKTRLPMRSDVGFPNAGEEEVLRKQTEIRHETEWEEASPRLAVLVTSDDLGTAVLQDERGPPGREHLFWNGGGLPGIPFAGKQLIQAKERNAVHFGRPSTGLTQFLVPSPYSMLAPPLDASYSPSEGWRPRPFHDRPAGMAYCLVCPVSVELQVGKAEPLLGSLALYTLPVGKAPRKGQAYGKMSEDFWFPAGDWNGKVQLDAVRGADGLVDERLLRSWFDRKHKAIFSYDPLALPGGRDSLFVVLQVYRMAHPVDEKEANGPHAQNVFEKFGTQLLTPTCFGVSRFYPPKDKRADMGDRMEWPRGETRESQLFASSSVPESQEAFLERLTTVARRISDGEPLASPVSTDGDDKSVESDAFEVKPSLSGASSESTKKRGGIKRLFRSPMKPTKTGRSKTPEPQAEPRNDDVILEGQGNIFVSCLSVDFLQSMLASPPELGEGSREQQRQLPQLLVDVTGDFAVLLDPNQSQQALPEATEAIKKRSNLLRLPTPTKSAGYMGASEYREVLYLPPRAEKHYDVDAPVSYRSLLNFLYLHPRLLRLSAGKNDLTHSNFTIRIRAIHTEAIVDEDTGRVGSRITALSSFHNPSPWAGPGLLKAAYTKVVGDVGNKSKVNFKNGVPMKDEIKMQLPKVLDGSYSLHITLCSFDLSDGGDDKDVVLYPVAEATIPLSSSSSLDGMAGTRVTTVIPNGNHRLKLGNFQLQLETRLVSSLHVGDPAVAIVLRDFPYAKDQRDERLYDSNPGLLFSPSRTASQTGESVADFDQSFSSLLSVASESTVLSYFQMFLYMHLCNLVNIKDKSDSSGTSATFMMGNMRSLFEVLRKVKSKLVPSRGSDFGRRRIEPFFKKCLDAFDEGFLSPVSSPWAEEGGTDLEVASVAVSDTVEAAPTGSPEDSGDDEDGDKPDEGAVRIRSKKLQQSQHDVRVSKNVAALGTSDVPFSRVAYGATKTDRMRIEAELHTDDVHPASFFDDDETIATVPSLQATVDLSKDKAGNGSAANNLWGVNAGSDGVPDDMSSNSIVRSASSAASPPPNASHRSIGNTEFAQRVRTAAQVILAPCVGPSLSNVLATGRASTRRSTKEEKKDDHSRSTDATFHQQSQKFICSPSSDVEDEIVFDQPVGSQHIPGRFENVFRGPPEGPLLLFSIKSKDGHEVPIASGDYIYESIMVLWLGAWIDHVEGSLTETLDTSSLTGREVATFTIPEYDPEKAADDSIYSFYAHMDFLLPLCLKSIVLRYSVEVLPMYPASTKAMVDDSHMVVLEPFVEMLARGLMGQALSGLGSAGERDRALVRAMSSSELVLDFIGGLMTVLHPEHMRVLIAKYFRTLHESETEHLGDSFSEIEFEWTEESLHRVRCSRQLRLLAVEQFAVLPSFVALNYPLKYSGSNPEEYVKKANWMHQYSEIPADSSTNHPIYPDGVERLPVGGWLSDIVLNETLSVCSLSCEAVVAEAMAHVEVSRPDSARSPASKASSLKKRPGAALKRQDLLMFQSLAIHAITAVYELIIRRHVMDKRFQTESSRGRLAALFAWPILEKSIASVRWLARMEATHKVRSTWLLCFVYILQETPDVMLREYVRSFCNPKNVRIHRFIRLLRLSSSTFQSFVDLQRHTMVPSDIDKRMSPWLLQESFNTICAATNTVVEECVKLTASYPREQQKIMQGILDLLLHVLTTPQSPVTHLRAVGGALQALEQFGADAFLEITGSALQHWIRVILSLMNSISLSVRSIAVDFVVSLLGSTFDLLGNVDEISNVFISVLPEVVAREVGLYSVGGHIFTIGDVAKALWPMRRAVADLEDTNPLDDDRVDGQLAPIIAVFCRTMQAVMDGVLVEMRLRGDSLTIVGTRVPADKLVDATFDADEESLFESANFFVPENAPMQRLRWLLTLKTLHESKGQWVEAAETLLLCARTISDSIPHLKNVWRPSRFVLWSDSRRSLWLETVGEDIGHPDRGNTQVMDFADDFLEPEFILGTAIKISATGKLQQPTVSAMCGMLISVTKEAVALYLREDGMDELAYHRLEDLLKAVMNVLEDHNPHGMGHGGPRGMSSSARKRHVEEETSLRRVLASLSGDMTSLAERLLLTVENEPTTPDASSAAPPTSQSGKKQVSKRPIYVNVRIFGKKPARFKESTTIPTFLEWNMPCICRVPKTITQKPSHDPRKWTKKLCLEFARPLLFSLQNECGANSVILRTEPGLDLFPDPDMTYLHVYPVTADNVSGIERAPSASSSNALVSKRFVHLKDAGNSKKVSGTTSVALIELTVAHAFPCALSRQRCLLTTEILSPAKGTAGKFGF